MLISRNALRNELARTVDQKTTIVIFEDRHQTVCKNGAIRQNPQSVSNLPGLSGKLNRKCRFERRVVRPHFWTKFTTESCPSSHVIANTGERLIR